MKSFLTICIRVMLFCLVVCNANAKITFLPDYEEMPIYFGSANQTSECAQILDDYGKIPHPLQKRVDFLVFLRYNERNR